MKKACKVTIFLLIISFFNTSQAQYVPLFTDTTIWSISPNFFPVVKVSGETNEKRSNFIWLGDYIVFSQSDTLINNTLYQKVFGNSGPNDLTFLNYYGAIREVNKQVYFISNGDSTENIYYDFNLNANDSIFLTFKYPIGNYPSAYYHVDSVVLKNYFVGSRNTWYLSKKIDQFSTAKITWAEGIGCLAHPFYLNTETYGFGPYSNCGCDFVEALVCQSKNNVKHYENNCIQTSFWNLPVDDCHFDIVGSIQDQIAEQIVVNPNPASDKINILLPNNKIKELLLFNSSGKILLKKEVYGNRFLTIATEHLENGIYFLKIGSTDVRKLVVMH